MIIRYDHLHLSPFYDTVNSAIKNIEQLYFASILCIINDSRASEKEQKIF